jgi:hypothetical protein
MGTPHTSKSQDPFVSLLQSPPSVLAVNADAHSEQIARRFKVALLHRNHTTRDSASQSLDPKILLQRKNLQHASYAAQPTRNRVAP